MSSQRAQNLTTRLGRLHARFLDPSHYDNYYQCIKCDTKKTFPFDSEPYEQCMVCSKHTWWEHSSSRTNHDHYERFQSMRIYNRTNRSPSTGTIKWITAKSLLMQRKSENVSVSFNQLNSTMCAEIYETSRTHCPENPARAIFLVLPGGNILWDCVSTIYVNLVEIIAKLGGVSAIAISSPDRLRNCDRLSYIFNECPIFLRDCYRTDGNEALGIKSAVFWRGVMHVFWDGVVLLHLGGYFAEKCILHFNREGGILFSGNIFKVASDKKSVTVIIDSVFKSSPNKFDIKEIRLTMEELEFDKLYGDLPGENIISNAKEIVLSSLEQFQRWVESNEE